MKTCMCALLLCGTQDGVAVFGLLSLPHVCDVALQSLSWGVPYCGVCAWAAAVCSRSLKRSVMHSCDTALMSAV